MTYRNMNQSELKEAVKVIKKELEFIKNNSLRIIDTEEQTKHWKRVTSGLTTLLDLANQYLDIKEPEEIEWEWCDSPNYNDAIHLCKLAQMKKLNGLEDMLEKQNPNQPISVLAQAIRQHMGGK